MSTVLPIVALSLAALVVLALTFVGLSTVSHVVHAFTGRVFQILILVIAAFSVIQTLLSGRVLRLGDSGLEKLAGGDMADFMVGKILLALIIGTSIAVCVAWALWGLAEKDPPSRYTDAGIAQLNKLTWLFLIYYAAFSFLPLAGAPKFAFHISLVYPFFVWLALLLSWRSSINDPVLVIRDGMALIVFASLVAAVLLPSLALQPGYQGLIPGFNMRLWGVVAAPNQMGAIASGLLIVQFIVRSQNPIRHHFVTLCTLITLALSQSKASIAAAVLGLSVLALWRLWHNAPDRPSNPERRMIGVLLFAFIAATLIAGIWTALDNPESLRAFERRFDSDAIGSLSTATGRVYIWQYAIKQGLESPLFGQGISIWNQEARAAIGLNGASSAHNLYLQAFSRAGVIGLAGLLAIIVLIATFAVKAAIISHGGSLALLAVFLVRSLFEVAFHPNSIFGAEFFSFIVMMIYITDRAALARGAVLPRALNALSTSRDVKFRVTPHAKPSRSFAP